MRVAIYARYSSENQREASIEDQVRLCKERIAREGWQLASVYADRAISGASTLRPGYQKMLADALAGRIDVVVAEALDRLSRDQEDVAGLFKRLRFAGVALVTLAEGEITELHVGLKGTMNALFLKDLADKTRRGLRGRVEAGCSGGGLTFGYDVVREIGSDGEPVHGGRAINEAEAVIVKRIFAEFAAGVSPRRIAFSLNAEHVPGPNGGEWGPSTINGNAARGTGILNNELYVGRMVWNRLRYIKDPETGRRISRLNPEAQWLIRDMPELRIVDDGLWDKVKARQKTLRKNTRPELKSQDQPFWERQRPKYLFSGLMKCGVCGGGYAKISQNLFGCATARNKNTCSNRLNIRRDRLEDIVLDGLRSRLLDPDIFKTFVAELHAEINRQRIEEGGRHEDYRRELGRVEHRLKRIVDAIADGAPVRSLRAELEGLEARRTEIETLLAVPENPQPLLHPNLAEIYRQRVAALIDSLIIDEHRARAMELIRSLVDEVRLIPEGGQLRVSLRGELAGILGLCEAAEAAKKPKAGGDAAGLAEQVKMVAGAGYQRYLRLWNRPLVYRYSTVSRPSRRDPRLGI
jgi:DNA invertase Pin-like site-specific DNA recombinase